MSLTPPLFFLFPRPANSLAQLSSDSRTSSFPTSQTPLRLSAKKLGKWDGSIQDFGAQGEHMEVVSTKEYVGDPAFCTATTQLVKVCSASKIPDV